MYVTKGQTGFGFCPGKATWDGYTVQLFRALVVASDTGAMWCSGGISEQPDWFIDLLGWFLPRYNDLRFNSRARAVLGSGDKNGK
jgi:hypothetical protein